MNGRLQYDPDIPTLTRNKLRSQDIVFSRVQDPDPESHNPNRYNREKFKIRHDSQDIPFVPQWVYRPRNGVVYKILYPTRDMKPNLRQSTKAKREQYESTQTGHNPDTSQGERAPKKTRLKQDDCARRKISCVPDNPAYTQRKRKENKRLLEDMFKFLSKRIDTINVLLLDDFVNGQQGMKTHTLGSVSGLVSRLGGIHASNVYIFNPDTTIIESAIKNKTHGYPMFVKQGLETIQHLPSFDGIYLDYTQTWKVTKRRGDLDVLFDPQRKLLSDTIVLHMTFSRRGISDDALLRLKETIKTDMLTIARGFTPVFQEVDIFPDSTKKTIKYYSVWERGGHYTLQQILDYHNRIDK